MFEFELKEINGAMIATLGNYIIVYSDFHTAGVR